MTTLPQLPFGRGDVLELAPDFAELRAGEPITKVRTETGDEAWLVTGYEEIRQIFKDDRFGRSHRDPASAPRLSNNAFFGGPTGDYATERLVHDGMRQLLAPAFSARRMARLESRVQVLVDELLDHMAEEGPPLDLHEKFAVPLPIQMICELLGVPYEDREIFRGLADEAADLADPTLSTAAADRLRDYSYAIVQAKRTNPGEDVYSDLAVAALPEDDIARIAGGLLFAGHETTVNAIDYGVLLFLRNPAQRDALLGDPALLAGAIEEILRLNAPSQHGVIRYAHEDVEIGGVRIRAGELLMLSTVAANRDERVFPDAERFDICRRSPEPHVGFGYAIRYCIGAGLARVELRAALGSLFRRFPTLRLAVPQEELRPRTDRLTGGFTHFPVAW